MSAFGIRNRYIDPYDPFWICRLLSLKVGAVTILMFIFNAFLLQPPSPVMYLMITVIAVLGSEVLPAPTRVKKLVNFMGLDFLLATTMMIFGLFSYFREAFFLFFIVFVYLTLRFMVANPKVAAVPALMIMFGVVSTGSGAATDFNTVANNYLYYLGFGMAGVVTTLFFPDFTTHTFNSAFLRILESDVAHVGDTNYKNSSPDVLAALAVIHGRLPLLPAPYSKLYEAIIEFQNAFMRPIGLTSEEQVLAKSVLSELTLVVNSGASYVLTSDNAQRLQAQNSAAYDVFERLVKVYNQCRV
jgi:hypothetical protein